MSKSQTPFEWLPDYDGLLEQIASTDVVDAEWTRLREIIKYKLDKNISLYLTQRNSGLPPPPAPFSPISYPSGGQRFPPFSPRQPKPLGDERKFPEPPKLVYTTEEANEFKESIYAQLEEFDGAPFTIQRVAELCLDPTSQYKYLGKYLRAVEKSLLVTSTWDSFPVPIPGETKPPGAVAADSIGNLSLSSAPSTPLFSPIPFLHDDARRSQSRSPPPSPLMLPSVDTPAARAESTEPQGLGLVDELDDPSPGHLSDHPHAISATTTVNISKSATLEERFVKASEPETHDDQPGDVGAAGGSAATEEKKDDEMVVDDPEKEKKVD